MNAPIPTPEGQVVKRTLQFIWLVDCSGSMSGKKIATLNQAIRESIPLIQKAAASNPHVRVQMRTIRFASNAEWHGGSEPVDLESFSWADLSAGGVTATAEAVRLLAGALAVDSMPARGFPPVCLLISDGFCTDPDEHYKAAIDALNNQPWGRKAVRLAIAVGDETEYDEPQLLKFVNHPEVGLLKAQEPEKMIPFIRWASVAAVSASSQGKSKGGSATDQSNVNLPPPPSVTGAASANDIF